MGRIATLTAALLPLPLLLTACEVVEKVQPVPVAEFGLWDDAAGDVRDPDLAAICRDLWDWTLANDPFWATRIGDPRFLAELPQVSERSRAKDELELEGFLERLTAIPAGALEPEDADVHRFLVGRLEAELVARDIDLAWVVDPVQGPLIRLQNSMEVQPMRTARERALLLERWAAVPGWMRDEAANLRRGASQGKVSSQTAIAKALAQVDAFLATDPMDSVLVKSATGGGRWVPMPKDNNLARVSHEELGDTRDQRDLRLANPHLLEEERVAEGTRVLIPRADDPLSPKERGEFLHAALEIAEDEVYPAVASYRDALASLIPRARPDDQPGLVHVPGGEALYRKAIHVHTSLPLDECDARAIHELGLAEIERIRAEIAEIGGRVLGTRDVAEIQRRLREDPAMHFATSEEVVAKAAACVRRAESRLAGTFGLRPRARCVVQAIPAYEAANATIAYYDAPEADGGRPGTYYVNASAPETRPRYEAEVLAFHEAVPGHHLQIAIAQELSGLPLYVRNTGWTVFVEGWALYVERLSDEMGLYSGDLDRLGMLSFDAWRAARLVVDTGLHAFGWSRHQAIAYLTENTLLARNNCENEVDRYIAWPGQALAYKIGQREIVALRQEARDALGSAYDDPGFHDAVLGRGAVSLVDLRANVRAWVTAQGGSLPIEAAAATER